MIKKAILKSFDDVNYTATVQIVGSLSTYLENVAVSRSIPPAAMQAGRAGAILFFSPANPKDAVLLAIWTQ